MILFRSDFGGSLTRLKFSMMIEVESFAFEVRIFYNFPFLNIKFSLFLLLFCDGKFFSFRYKRQKETDNDPVTSRNFINKIYLVLYLCYISV